MIIKTKADLIIVSLLILFSLGTLIYGILLKQESLIYMIGFFIIIGGGCLLIDFIEDKWGKKKLNYKLKSKSKLKEKKAWK